MRFLKYAVSVIILTAIPLRAQNFSSEKTYRAAIQAFKERNYYSARLLFQEILHKDNMGEYADRAQYYNALTFFYEGEYKSAIFEFRLLQRDYPTSSLIPKAAYWIGESYYFQKEYKQALEQHHDFVREYPQHPQAPYALYTTGYIYNEMKRYDEAIAEFERVMKNYSESKVAPRVGVQLGIAYYNIQDYTRARNNLQKVLTGYSNTNMTDEAQFWIGKTYYAEENFDEAAKQFKYVLEKYPESHVAPEALYLIALIRYQKNDSAESISILKELLKKYPSWEKIDSVHLRLGQLYYERKVYETAFNHLNTVIEKYPSSEFLLPALDLAGNIRREQGRSAEAIALYEKALSSENFDRDSREKLYRKKADLLLRDGQFTRAAETYLKTVEKYPDSEKAPEALYLAAQSYYTKGLFKKSDKLLDDLVRKYSSRAPEWKGDAYYLRGEIAFALTDYDRALKEYYKVLRFYKDHRRYYDSYIGVGWCYFELKQYSRAADVFRKVIRKTGESEYAETQIKARMALASSFYNLRAFDKALEQYDKVIAEKEKFPVKAREAVFQSAWLHYRRRNYDKAIDSFTDYRNNHKDGERIIESLYFTGWSYFRKGEYEKAVDFFGRTYENAGEKSVFKEKAMLDRAKTLMILKKWQAAEEMLWRFTGLYAGADNIDEAYYNLARVYLKQSNTAGAVTAYEKLKQIDEKSSYLSEILREIGDYYRREGQLTEADSYYSRIIENANTPDEKWEAVFSRAELFAQQPVKASEILSEVLESREVESKPYKGRALLKLAEIFYNAEKYKEAEDVLNKYEPDVDDEFLTKELRIWRARIQIAQGEYSAARKTLRPLTRDNNFALTARFYTGLSYYKDERLSLAYDFMKTVAQKSEGVMAPQALFYLGEIHLKQKEYKQAAREFTKVVYLYSGDRDLFEKALYKTALSYREVGREKEFNSYVKKLKEAFPESEYIKKLNL